MVREGTDSKDFERQPLELRKIDQFCFVVYFGNEFKLKTLSVAGVCVRVCVCVCARVCVLWRCTWHYAVIVMSPCRYHTHSFMQG